MHPEAHAESPPGLALAVAALADSFGGNHKWHKASLPASIAHTSQQRTRNQNIAAVKRRASGRTAFRIGATLSLARVPAKVGCPPERTPERVPSVRFEPLG